jgi:hypothetical protein
LGIAAKDVKHMTTPQPLTKEQAIECWTELQRRVRVGAYLELQHDGSYPEDDGSPESTTLVSLDNLVAWSTSLGLEFTYNHETKQWSLEPIESPRSGECAECGRDSSQLSATGYCEGCIMQAAIDATEE